MSMRQRGRFLIVSLIVAILTLTSASIVSAHAQYKSSDPPANGTVQKAPTQVAITFSEETDPLKSGGSVADASGATVSTGFKVDLNERTNMTIALKPNLPSGIYTVKWNSFTDDDNGVADGTFIFTIQATAASAAATGTTPAGASAVAGTAPASATVTTAATVAPTATPAATTAPTATVAPTTTRAATTVVATSVGGGVTTGTATTLPATGKSDGGIGSPWVIWAALIGAFVLAIGLGVRARTTYGRR
ncbi:MAG: copper resistance CopC family protein [Thermomicrobiales bacterium]